VKDHEAIVMTKNLLTALFLCGALAGAQPEPTSVAIRNAKIVIVSGPVITKGTLVLRGGLIESVGENVTPPADALVIDGDGLTVYPGLIDALSTWGIPTPPPAGRGGTVVPPEAHSWGPEDRPATTSWIKAADLIQPNDRRFEAAREAGFSTAAVFPTRGIFGGQGSLINLAGPKPAELVIVPSLGQYISMQTLPQGAGFPGALMGVIAYVRQIYLDADHYTMMKAAYDRDPRGMKRPEYDRALEGVLESKRILLPANRWMEVARMVRFGAELKQPTILYGMHEGFDARAVDHLKGQNTPVLVSLKWPEAPRDTDPDDVDTLEVLAQRAKAPTAPAVLKQAGIPFAFYSDGIDQARDLDRAVKKAIDNGLPRDAAVRALTLSAAEIYGVADRLGSIEKGKIANLVVTRGEIFDDRTKVEMVFIDGVRHTPAPPAGGRGNAATENRK
jgi:imidazolonepropionase-like amidohydrolase